MGGTQLYGDHRSGNCYKVAWLLRALQQPFEWIETDALAGATRTQDFLALNVNGRVPLLRFDGSQCLAESNAILLYLAEHTYWLPTDSMQRAGVYQWLFFEQYSHEPYIAVARSLVHLQGRADTEIEWLKQLHTKGYAALDVMESVLQKQPWFGGPQISIGDIALYAYTHTARDGLFSLDDYPVIRRWLGNIEAREDHIPMTEACRSFIPGPA